MLILGFCLPLYYIAYLVELIDKGMIEVAYVAWYT